MTTTDHHFGAYPKEEPLGPQEFGGCPVCHSHDGFYNAGKGHWFVCREHRTRWFVGSNLFSAWREETEEEQRHAYEVEPGWGFYEDITKPDASDVRMEPVPGVRLRAASGEPF